MNYSLRNMVVAFGLAVVAVAAVLVYTSNIRQRAQADQERVKVYVAASDIEPGTTGEQVIAQNLLVQREIVRTDQAPGALTSLAGLENKVATQKLFKDTQVVAPVFAEPAFVADQGVNLQGNMRAMQVPMNSNAGLIGQIKQGDHIDILQAIKITNANGSVTPVVRPLMRNVLVLQIEQGDEKGIAKSTDDETGVMLAVTDIQAGKLLWAKENATLWFLARPAGQAGDSPYALETIETMVLDGLNPKQRDALTKNLAIEAK